MRFFHSLFFKLLLCLLLISIIPLIAVGYITYNNTSETMTENLDFHANSILQKRVDTIQELNDKLKRISNGIVTNKVFSTYTRNDDNEIHKSLYLELDKLLVSIQNVFPSLEGITIINDKNLIYYYGYSMKSDINAEQFTKSSWFPKGDKLAYPEITPAHTREYSNFDSEVPVYSYVYKGWDNQLKNYSYIIIDFSKEFLTETLNNKNDSSTSSGSLIYNTEQYIHQIQNSPLFSYSALLKPSNSIIEDVNGDKFVIYKQDIPNLDWTIVEYFKVNSLYKPIYDLQSFFALTVAISVFICIIASLFVTRQISSPIYKMQRKMKEVEAGNFKQQFITNSKDVIGNLARGFNQMLGQIQVLIESVTHQEKLKREAEITALQLQINPHFLYNTLESINSLARKKKEYEISNLIVLLGRLLRLSISSFEESIPVEQELLYIKYYLKIQQKRMRNKLTYAINVENKMKKEYIIKWILQPLVENAIIHGIESDSEAGHIEVKGKLENEHFTFTITDNGKGISPEQLLEIRTNLKEDASDLTKYKNRIGLYNVQARINLYYGSAYIMEIDSIVDIGTQITIRIPRRNNDD